MIMASPAHVTFTLQAEMDALFVRLFTYSADIVKRVEVVCAERVKTLEAQADAEVAAQALALPQPCEHRLMFMS